MLNKLRPHIHVVKGYIKQKKSALINRIRGFTLIELLVVIVIISVLAVVGIALFNNVQKSAQDARRKADVAAIAQAMEAHYDPISGKYLPLEDNWFADGVQPKDPVTKLPYPVNLGNLTDPDSTNDYTGFMVCTSDQPGSSCTESSQVEYTGPLITMATPTPTPTATPTSSPTASPTTTPTPGPQFIGNPFKARYADNDNYEFARNVWDMQVFNGRIYLGHGNSSNVAPALNAGNINPGTGGAGIDVWYFDPAVPCSFPSTTTPPCGFTTEYRVQEETIDIYRINSSFLNIPGHDKNGGPVNGRFYKLISGSWQQQATITNVEHVFDIYQFGTNLFAAVGPTGTGFTGVRVSTDGSGGSFVNATCKGSPAGSLGACPDTNRAYHFFEMGGKLYVSWPSANIGGVITPIAEYESGDTFVAVPTTTVAGTMVPSGGAFVNNSRRIERFVKFGGQTVYIVATTVNGNQWNPVSIARASVIGSATQIILPGTATPRDILVDGATIYILAHTGSAPNFTNSVFSSDSTFSIWNPVLSFTHETAARSFEYLNGYFYFGMGASTAIPIPNSTGDIIQYRYP